MKRHFTLIEVVVALGILALSITGLLQLLIAGQKRAAQSYEKWDHMHKISQAAEYLMLFDEDTTSVPNDFFPYNDYHLNVKYVDTEGLPEDLNDLSGQLPLHTLSIELIRTADYQTKETLLIDRIQYDTATVSSERSQP